MSVLSLPSCFHRDLAEGLQQQMFFWGQDVLHPTGNFLKKQGFTRSPSTGLKGTSCYRRTWQNGHIELYGSCAGWYNEDGGFTFIRPRRRCYVWNSAQETPVPGDWQTEFCQSVTRNELYTAALPFLDWLITYEESVLDNFGTDYRLENYREYRKVPKARQWAEPSAAFRWFKCLRDTPNDLKRPKHYSSKGLLLAQR